MGVIVNSATVNIEVAARDGDMRLGEDQELDGIHVIIFKSDNLELFTIAVFDIDK